MKPRISLRGALNDSHLFKPILGDESWSAWRTLMIAAMGECLTEEERVTFKALTQREYEPLERVETLVVIALPSGREKSFYGRPGDVYRRFMRS